MTKRERKYLNYKKGSKILKKALFSLIDIYDAEPLNLSFFNDEFDFLKAATQKPLIPIKYLPPYTDEEKDILFTNQNRMSFTHKWPTEHFKQVFKYDPTAVMFAGIEIAK